MSVFLMKFRLQKAVLRRSMGSLGTSQPVVAVGGITA